MVRKVKNNEHPWAAKALLITFIVVGFGFFIDGIFKARVESATADWQPVEAVITFYEARCCWGKDDEDYIHVRYKYTVNHMEYESDRVESREPHINQFGEAEYNWKSRRQYKVGNKITAYVSNMGNQAVLEVGLTQETKFQIGFSLFWFLLSLYGYFNPRKGAK